MAKIEAGVVYLRKGDPLWPRLVVSLEGRVAVYIDALGWGTCTLETLQRWAGRSLGSEDEPANKGDLEKIAAFRRAGPPPLLAGKAFAVFPYATVRT